MRVLWLCNIMLPVIAKHLGLPYSNKEGWLTGSYERLNGGGPESAGVELGVCFPVEQLPDGFGFRDGTVDYGSTTAFGSRTELQWRRFLIGRTACYAFEEKLAAPERYQPGLERSFVQVLEDFRPDMVHIFGTEYPHTLAMSKAFGRPDRLLIGIQGLCSACAEVYTADLPARVVKRKTFRDLIRIDGIERQQEKFRRRGAHEAQALARTGNITGRTDFDREETAKINGEAVYYFMNETMRAPFYSGRWQRENCVPHSIFLSQGDYPLKGFHYVLTAMGEIIRSYPDACVYVAGSPIIDNKTWKDKLKLSSYGKYLLELIGKCRLDKNVKLLGKLSAEEMKERFLKSSVFVCPSSVENSPNSMGEAMLLGVPVVAAGVGGIPSLIETELEGLLYEAGNEAALAKAVMRVWEEPERTAVRSEAARRRALQAHDADKNYERMLEIYREICT